VETIRIYTRQSAQVNGRALHTEPTRRLREAGAAGITTIRAHWGFSSDEPPQGDQFARLASQVPTYTTYIDRPSKVAAVWPVIDELTADHGIVTSFGRRTVSAGASAWAWPTPRGRDATLPAVLITSGSRAERIVVESVSLAAIVVEVWCFFFLGLLVRRRGQPLTSSRTDGGPRLCACNRPGSSAG
jgi:PII-like signaling protein